MLEINKIQPYSTRSH